MEHYHTIEVLRSSVEEVEKPEPEVEEVIPENLQGKRGKEEDVD